MSKERLRNRSIRKSKRVILISLEGKNKTEKTYFENFNCREKEYIIKVVPGNETDPANLVNQTIKKVKDLKLNLDDDDRAFCIFDTDTDSSKNLQIDEAIKNADKYNIKVVTTSPCIELWFLLHYTYTTSSMDNVTIINRLKKYCPKYSKNYNIYPTICNKTKSAYNNAIKLEKYQKSNNRNIQHVESNPHSEVYKIIEELESKR